MDRVQRLNGAAKPDAMAVPAPQRAVAFHVAAVAAVAAEVAAVVATCDCDWQLLVQHFVTMFGPPVSAGSCDATCRRQVAE